MDFNCKNIKTGVNAEEAEIGSWGYFANNLGALRKSIEQERITLSSLYAQLITIKDEENERRFLTEVGSFSLFYETDKLENDERY